MQGKIGREDIADLCVHLLTDKVARNTTFEVKSTLPFSEPWEGSGASEGSAGNDWQAELSAAGLKQGVTGRTVDGVYTGAVPEAEALARQPVSV